MPHATHLLDTSALLAHYFDEPGAAEVDAIWQNSENKPAICVLSIPELRTRIQAEVQDTAEVDRVMEQYVNHLTISLPVDRPAAEEAALLRESATSRLPLVDACIAGCAKRFECVLVHRDPHMDHIPAKTVKQMRLPDKIEA